MIENESFDIYIDILKSEVNVNIKKFILIRLKNLAEKNFLFP